MKKTHRACVAASLAAALTIPSVSVSAEPLPAAGAIDDARIYDRALTVDDGQEIFAWTGVASKAFGDEHLLDGPVLGQHGGQCSDDVAERAGIEPVA
mgnify:CR=1 FL=1